MNASSTMAPEHAAAATPDSVKEALLDVVTHRKAWRDALLLAGAWAAADDRSYWRHELAAFDRTFDALTEAIAKMIESAARWDALMICPRIRMLGSAGVDPKTGERTNGDDWVHFGAEFWSRYDMERLPHLKAEGEASTQWGRHALTAVADDIIAQGVG